jgi:hypothetical protein
MDLTIVCDAKGVRLCSARNAELRAILVLRWLAAAGPSHCAGPGILLPLAALANSGQGAPGPSCWVPYSQVDPR